MWSMLSFDRQYKYCNCVEAILHSRCQFGNGSTVGGPKKSRDPFTYRLTLGRSPGYEGSLRMWEEIKNIFYCLILLELM